MVASKRILFFSTALFFLTAVAVFAGQDRVKSISKDGTLEFESGRSARLLGVELRPEALRILPTLLAGQEIDIEEESGQIDTSTNISKVYLYVKNKEIDFPFTQNKNPSESKKMINAFLISTGAAKVSADTPFKKMDEFLKLEEQAKLEGEGMWSYDMPAKKSSQ